MDASNSAHLICQRCKTLLRPSPFGTGCQLKQWQDSAHCPFCQEDADLQQHEDRAAYQNDLAAHLRFHQYTAPYLLTMEQRQQAERAGLTPHQLRADRQLRRAEQGAAHEAVIRARFRDSSRIDYPSLPDQPQSVQEKQDEDAFYALCEDVVVAGTRHNEEEVLEAWRERRLETGVVEPRPTVGVGDSALASSDPMLWELDVLLDAPRASSAPPRPSLPPLSEPLQQRMPVSREEAPPPPPPSPDGGGWSSSIDNNCFLGDNDKRLSLPANDIQSTWGGLMPAPGNANTSMVSLCNTICPKNLGDDRSATLDVETPAPAHGSALDTANNGNEDLFSDPFLGFSSIDDLSQLGAGFSGICTEEHMPQGCDLFTWDDFRSHMDRLLVVED